MRHMLTRQELADMLHDVNVAEVARRAELSEKTIYRLRHQKFSPRWDTVEAILAAIDAIKRAARTEKAGA
jgi:DNA-binding phage protein